MILDFILILRPNALSRILFKQGVYEVLALVGYLSLGVVEEELAVDDVLEHLLVIAVVKGRRTVHHLEDQDTEGPPVSHEGLALARDDLGT
jgi:hypothetical protein